MTVEIVSILYVDNKHFKIGDHIEVEIKQGSIQGELVALFHDKIVVTPERDLPYWIELGNIVDVK